MSDDRKKKLQVKGERKTKQPRTRKDKGGAGQSPAIKDALEVPADDPYEGIDFTGDDGQAAVDAEAVAMKQALREADNRYAEKRNLINQSEYWFCMVFETREQKDIFLNAMGWINLGDKYLDGTQIARMNNIELPKVELPPEPPTKNKRWDEFISDEVP
jgi:hypothetical protein